MNITKPVITIHELKCVDPYYTDLSLGYKTFDIRFNDRDYKVGNLLHMRKWCTKANCYSGHEDIYLVRYVTDYDQRENYIVMGVKKIHAGPVL